MSNKIPFYEMSQSIKFIRISYRLIIYSFILIFFFLLFVPWQQSSTGQGSILALNPEERLQHITAPLGGRIAKWYVTEGSEVSEGDPLVEIVDNDPMYIQRLEAEREAIIKKMDASRISSTTALIDLKRQEELWREGLSSRKDYEKANIEYKKLIATEASVAAELAKVDTKVSRQQTQLLRAPRKGKLLRIIPGTNSVLVKEGDKIAYFVPDSSNIVAEISIDGNDVPLIKENQKVRLQFEGWPAIQFSGWPSIAIGTFGGVVKFVDSSTLDRGKFRVIVAPDPSERPWPNQLYLRQGSRAFAWILLSEVTVGFELWRKLNGFPASISSENDFSYFDNKNSVYKDKKSSKEDEGKVENKD